MQGILGAAVGASGTPKGAKEALKVCVCGWGHGGGCFRDLNCCMSSVVHVFVSVYRTVQCVQDCEDDHGEELSACDHFQLQQERV